MEISVQWRTERPHFQWSRIDSRQRPARLLCHHTHTHTLHSQGRRCICAVTPAADDTPLLPPQTLPRRRQPELNHSYYRYVDVIVSVCVIVFGHLSLYVLTVFAAFAGDHCKSFLFLLVKFSCCIFTLLELHGKTSHCFVSLIISALLTYVI